MQKPAQGSLKASTVESEKVDSVDPFTGQVEFTDLSGGSHLNKGRISHQVPSSSSPLDTSVPWDEGL